MNDYSSLNLSSALVAALLVEQGEYSQEDITIQPMESIPGGSLREVLEIKPKKNNGGLTIFMHSKSLEKQQLETNLKESESLRILASLFEQELTFFRIGRVLRERQHLLGLSPLQASFYEETKNLCKQQQKILAFFLPYGSQIRGDMVLMEKCLQAALNMGVKLEVKTSRNWKEDGAIANKCTLNGGAVAGGLCTESIQCIRVLVGPVPLDLLLEFIPGAYWYHFLENALLPLFMAKGWTWEIEISVAPDDQAFCIPNPERPLCTGINSIIQ